MKQTYKSINFSGATLKLIQFLDGLIQSYQQQGFVLSVRQLYYQCVARNVIPNTEQSYKRLAGIVNDARLAGYLDWDAIEDRGRDVVVRSRWNDGSSILRAVAKQFHMDMWKDQHYRVFVVVEKAALAGVLEGICHEYDVPLLAARGYPSVSVVRDMVLQHIVPALRADQTPVVLHLGDHDPSGIDMTRDLLERMHMFIAGEGFSDWNLERIALTMEQIEEKNPPPNPAKTTDSRFSGYMREFGDESWELDALEPAYLVSLVRSHIQRQLDDDMWRERQVEIEGVRSRLEYTASTFK